MNSMEPEKTLRLTHIHACRVAPFGLFHPIPL